MDWLSKGYQKEGIIKISDFEKGGLDEALTKAHNGQTGILTWKELERNDMVGFEVGAVLFLEQLSYTTYFTKNESDNVYAVHIRLPFYTRTEPDETDEKFINVYRQVVSTFNLQD
jgi:hypothetical protein